MTVCAVAAQQNPVSLERQLTVPTQTETSARERRRQRRTPVPWTVIARGLGAFAAFVLIIGAAGAYYGQHHTRDEFQRNAEGMYPSECARLYARARDAADSSVIDYTQVGTWRSPSTCGVSRWLNETRDWRRAAAALTPSDSLRTLAHDALKPK